MASNFKIPVAGTQNTVLAMEKEKWGTVILSLKVLKEEKLIVSFFLGSSNGSLLN